MNFFNLDPARFDLFELWRRLLAITCTVYAIILTYRSIAYGISLIIGRDRHTLLLRRYVILHLLRLRGMKFLRELAGIVFYAILFLALLSVH